MIEPIGTPVLTKSALPSFVIVPVAVLSELNFTKASLLTEPKFSPHKLTGVATGPLLGSILQTLVNKLKFLSLLKVFGLILLVSMVVLPNLILMT